MVVFLNCICFLCTVLLHLRALASARPQRTDSLIDGLIHYRICPSLPDQCTVTRSYLFLHKFWFFSTIYYFGNWAFIAVSQLKDVANKRASPLKFHCWTFSARRQTTAWYFLKNVYFMSQKNHNYRNWISKTFSQVLNKSCLGGISSGTGVSVSPLNSFPLIGSSQQHFLLPPPL